ncbi:MAG: hypothetical protein ABSC55_02185 [Syntrophorhabdales bacterium]
MSRGDSRPVVGTMGISYNKNYLKIYVWQFLAMATNIFSLFIVIPFLSKETTLYGIYSICASSVLLLNYADIGFLSAGCKYAAESFARGERVEEIRITGFVLFVLSVFVLLFAGSMLLLIFFPEVLIANLSVPGHRAFASQLFTILMVFSPAVLIQRAGYIIYGIRLEDFIYQRLMLVANLIKIGSIYLFFSNGSSDIVGYFFFIQSVSLFAAVSSLVVARKRYHYDFGLLIRSIRFSRKVYATTRALALSSLLATATWVLFHELDLYAIARFLGPREAGLYAIALSVFALIRTFNGVIFAPFGTRFNYFRGLNDEEGLQTFYRKVVTLTQPIVLFPTLSVILFMSPLILCWVGPGYEASVRVGRLLSAVFLFSFVASPAGMLILAREQTRLMNFVSVVLASVYWGGVLLTLHHLGIDGFAYMKLISFSVCVVIYWVVSTRLLRLRSIALVNRLILPILPAVAVVTALSLVCLPYMPHAQGKVNLLLVGLNVSLAALVGMAVNIAFSPEIRTFIREVGKPLLIRSFQPSQS